MPSDKLSLVEGSNGPRLSCEAWAEPQVQFRWLLLRGGNNVALTSSDLVAARYNLKHFGAESPDVGPVAGRGQQQQQRRHSDAIHQPTSTITTTTTTRLPKSVAAGLANDVGGSQPPEAEAGRPVEVTGAEQVGGAPAGGPSVSTLDLSGSSIDRKQSGHYICEASNRLGQTRQSVYVNVLCKYLGPLAPGQVSSA